MPAVFSDHVTFVDRLLHHREEIVERIERALLNVRDKETSRRRDRLYFERTFESCFFGLADLSPEMARLKGDLAARHRADGFEPVTSETTYVYELDPLELILRAYEWWNHHRWPGRSGRLSYAQALYGVFVLRQLEGLSLRIWDDSAGQAGGRLDTIQHLLDRLNRPSGPVFIRSAAWLIQTAQGPLTKHLKPYFVIADRIAASLDGRQRLDVHTAGARLAGGHLRSQLRYRVWLTNRPPDDPENLSFTRNSNALDGALLVRDLVALLEAYRAAVANHDDERRLDLADAILQGVSADPELYVTRLDLLAPYVMVEHLFIERTDDGPQYTAMGETARASLARYGALIGELAASIRQDAALLDPARGPYSPHGVTYGFCADVLSNMAQDPLHGPVSSRLSLEDMFVSRGDLEHKLARATGWARLPRRTGERAHFDHSLALAAESYTCAVDALTQRALSPGSANASGRRTARVFLGSGPAGAIGVDDHCVTSDVSCVRPAGPVPYSRDQLIVDRNEGRFLASARVGDEWFGISKVILTTFTAQGTDAVISNVPHDVADVLRLTGPEVVVPPDTR